MPSLLEALEEKYGLFNSRPVEADESLVSIFVPKLPPRLSVPELLVLNDCNIDKAGEAEDLKKKCHTVRELDLAQNKLNNWNEVFSILAHMPRVEFVNLSLNQLTAPLIESPCCRLDRLRSLVLNNTKLEWTSVESLLSCLPALEELHLSLNEYTHVLIDTIDEEENVLPTDIEIAGDDDEDVVEDVCLCNAGAGQTASYTRSDSVSSVYKKTNAHNAVKILHLNGNPIADWSEICRVGRVFPNLQSLVLADCPLSSLDPLNGNERVAEQTSFDEVPHTYFGNLQLLNLNNTNIKSWDDIDYLSKFPVLTNLRVQNWPLWDSSESTEHERRQLLIARLPNVQILNGGGVISQEEREDSERAFIRFYLDKPESDRPERYNELVSIHGRLDPLVNIDLRPEKRVKITFVFGEMSETRCVDVYRTVFDLKIRLERIVGIAAAKMRLYYVDQEMRDLMGPEEMKYPSKRLYSYNIRSGDEIIIDQKR